MLLFVFRGYGSTPNISTYAPTATAVVNIVLNVAGYTPKALQRVTLLEMVLNGHWTGYREGQSATVLSDLSTPVNNNGGNNNHNDKKAAPRDIRTKIVAMR